MPRILSFPELATSLVGKTIENVSAANASAEGATELVLYLSDGSEMLIHSTIVFQGNNEFPAESGITLEQG